MKSVGNQPRPRTSPSAKPKQRGPRGRPKGSASVKVYGSLRERILALQLAPGQEIDETALATEFGVSRTPIREALLRLSSEELIDLVANRPAKVSSINFFEVGEIFEALEVSQRIITRLACVRHTAADLEEARQHATAYAEAALRRDFRGMADANYRFHSVIARASRNRFLSELSKRLLDQTLRMASLVLRNAFENDRSYKRYIARVNAEHDEMLKHIASGDVEAADQLARKHSQLFKERLAAYVLDGHAGDIDLS